MNESVGFVDLHVHVLPGLDDGPADLDHARLLCEKLHADGVTKVAATCHQRGHFARNLPEHIRAATQTLTNHLRAANIPLELVPSAEWMMDAATVDELQSLWPELLTIADAGKYALLEFPLRFPPYISRIAEAFQARELVGVLAHIEKYPELVTNPKRVEEIAAQGFVMQMNADSIVGRWGERVAKRCQKLLTRGVIHLVASDAHSIDLRPPFLTEAFTIVENITSTATAKLLFQENPAAILAGEKVTSPVRKRWYHFR